MAVKVTQAIEDYVQTSVWNDTACILICLGFQHGQNPPPSSCAPLPIFLLVFLRSVSDSRALDNAGDGV